jgi:YVTN family beta-propeller protein
MESKASINFLAIVLIPILLLVYSADFLNIIALADNSNIISSLSVLSSQPLTRKTGIAVNSFPVGIAVNPVTNMIYVSNEFSNTLSVINGNQDLLEDTIFVGSLPYGIDIDPFTNRMAL